MAYPEFDAEDLAGFSGRDVASYPMPYTTTALNQATLLFKLATCRKDWTSTDPDETQLMEYAILSVADGLVLAQPFQAVKATPFSSESIGSYSYSKMSSAVKNGESTGDVWFDMAVDQLSQCEAGSIMYGGTEVFEHDGHFVSGQDEENKRLVSPSMATASTAGLNERVISEN